MSEMKMTEQQWQVLAHLASAAKRDSEKGWNGLRNARDVADSLSITVDRARYALHRLTSHELVDCYDEKPLAWRISDSGRAALSQEPRS